MGKILHRYLLRELLTPFALGLTIFTFVLLMARLLKLIELVVNRGLPFLQILQLIGYLLPAFMEVTLPMAMLLAILIAFGRLSSDSELIAIRSSGVSLYQLLPPVAIFVVVTTGLTMVLSMVGRPWGNRSMRTALYDIAQTHAAAGLKPQVFNDEFPGLVIYAERIDGTRDRLYHVLISDERDPKQRNTIFAREGTMISDPDAQTVTLRLLNGAIHSSEADGKSEADYRTEFEAYDVNLDLRQALAGAGTLEDRPAEMTLAQLDDAIARKRDAKQPYGPELVEWHRKFAIPFACIVFGLVAVPLGTERSRAVKSRGFAVSLVVIFVYYILLSAGQGLAQQNRIPAFVGLWTPNVVFALLGLWLLRRAARERPLIGAWVEPFAAALRARMPRRLLARVGA
jgi:lipopolysaccharide export system permease protein